MMTENNLREAERTARCDLLAARDETAQSHQLESAIFDAYIAASKANSAARKRENAAFDRWYAASKALNETTAPKLDASCTPRHPLSPRRDS